MTGNESQLVEMVKSFGGELLFVDEHVDAVYLGHSGAGDDDLVCFTRAAFPRLKALDLTGTVITDQGLVSLAKQQQLEVLRLGRTSITGAGLGGFDLPELKTLYLRGCSQFGPEGAALIPRFTALEELWLNKTGIDDSCLAHVGKLSGLKKLWIDETEISDTGLPYLYALTELESINTAKTDVTTEGLSRLFQKLRLPGPGLIL